MRNTLSHDLRRWAAREPDRLAAADGPRQVSFGEFDRRVDALSTMLDQEIDRSSLQFLPVLTGIDTSTLVAIHACIRAGIAFAPIDPTLPAPEIRSLLDRLGAPELCLLTDGADRSVVPSGVWVLREAAHVSRPSPVAIAELDADAPAFVVFTSGSTGRAKGVVHSWASLHAMAAAVDDEAMSGPARARIAQPFPSNFLAGIRRSMAVCTGRSLVLLRPAELTPVDLIGRIRETRIEHLGLITSLAEQVADAMPTGETLESVTCFLTGAERVDRRSIDAIASILMPGAAIVLAYGTTEAPDLCRATATELVTDVETDGDGLTPIGHAADADRLSVEPIADLDSLDAVRESAPTPGAVIGELVVHGGVALGYLDDPELTARRFFLDDRGRWSWRSGDIVRRDPDGTFTLLGRLDAQIKIRGRLVDPSQSESVLRSLPGVRAAAVVARTATGGRSMLVGHLQLDPRSELTAADLRAGLAARLPQHLVPSFLMRHDELPVDDRGKTARSVLRELPLDPWFDTPPKPPMGHLQRFLVVTLREILELDLAFDAIGVDEELWNLGLDSLGAAELVMTINDSGFPEVTLRDVLDNPTIETLANVLRDGVTARDSDVVTINPGGTAAPLFFVPGAGSTALKAHHLGRALGSDATIHVIEPRGMHTVGEPDRTIDAMADHVATTIGELRPTGPIVLAGWSAGGYAALEAARRLRVDGREVRLVLINSLHDRDEADVPPEPDPGPPSGRLARYRAFSRIMGRAALLHHLEPCDVPTLLLRVEDPEKTWGLVAQVCTDLNTIVVSGDDRSLLEPPYVDDAAAVIRPLLERSESTPPGDYSE